MYDFINPYSFFDDIICINIDVRQDKRKRMSETFQKLEIPCRFFTAKTHPKGGRYGCFESHIAVIRQAYYSNKQNILIFEDDILPTPTYSIDNMQKAVTFLLDKSPDVDILFLGSFPGLFVGTPHADLFQYAKTRAITPNIIKFKPLAAHAYCLTKSGMKKILDTYANYLGTMHYDVYLTKIDVNSYCFIPILFEQLFCMGTNNSIHGFLETFFRKYQCEVEKDHLLHKISFIKYYYEQYRNIILFNTLVIIILIIFFFQYY